MGDTALLAGVIGGLGPSATIDFMARVVALTPATSDQDHVHLLVDQNPTVPDRQDAILRDGVSCGPVLAKMAAGLEASGCDFLVMPCNTAHAFQHDIVTAVEIPFISIVEVTIDAIPSDVTTIGLMATPACVKTGIYQSALRAQGLDFVLHNSDQLDRLMGSIYDVKSTKWNSSTVTSMRALATVLVSQGAEAIIMACTEIPLLLRQNDMEVHLVSSTKELARRTVLLARGELPLPTI